MKHLIYTVLLACLAISCKDNKNPNTQQKPIPITEKIAQAYGFEHWKDISQIAFTFNVDRDTIHSERSWTWNPKTNDVTLISNNDGFGFNSLSE